MESINLVNWVVKYWRDMGRMYGKCLSLHWNPGGSGLHLCGIVIEGIGLDSFAAVARGGGFWRVTLLFAWVGERKTVGYGLVFKERKGSR